MSLQPDRTYRRNLPHIQSHRPVFVTFTTRDRFILPETCRDLVLDHCLYDHGKRIWLHAAVVMPDHVHLVLSVIGDATFPAVMQGIKGSSARSVNRHMERTGSLWQSESFDRVMRLEDNVDRWFDDMEQNPVEAGLLCPYPWLWREWIEGQTGMRTRAR